MPLYRLANDAITTVSTRYVPGSGQLVVAAPERLPTVGAYIVIVGGLSLYAVTGHSGQTLTVAWVGGAPEPAAGWPVGATVRNTIEAIAWNALLDQLAALTGTDLTIPQAPNSFLAGPTTGPSAVATFRAMGAGDLPNHTHASVVQGGILNFPRLTSGILDTNGANLLGVGATASAVNYVFVNNAITAQGPSLTAAGTDTNINLGLAAKGTGAVEVTSLLRALGGLTLPAQTANYGFFGPVSGVAGTPGFRALVPADVPVLAYVATDTVLAPNYVWASPVSGAAAVAGWRQLQPADIPALPYLSTAPVLGAHSFWAGPASGTAVAAWRSIAASDLPALDYVSSTTSLAANYVYASPSSGGSGVAGWRQLVATDIPTLSYIPSTTAQAASTSLRGPISGAAAAPTWRTTDLLDLPALTAVQSALGCSGTTSSATDVDAPGPGGSGYCSVVITTNGGPVLILFTAQMSLNAAVHQFRLSFMVDSTDLGFFGLPHSVATAGNNLPVSGVLRHTPAAGTYTYKVRWSVASGSDTLTMAYGNLIVMELKK